MVTDWVGDPGAVVEYGVRFTRPVVVPDDDRGALIEVTGNVAAKLDDGTVRVDLAATTPGRRCSAGPAPSSGSADAGATGAQPASRSPRSTTLRLGGPARRLAGGRTEDEVVEAVRARQRRRAAAGPRRRQQPRRRRRGLRRHRAAGRDPRHRRRRHCAGALAAGRGRWDWDRVVACAVAGGYAGLEASPASPARAVPRRSRTSAPTARRSPHTVGRVAPATAATDDVVTLARSRLRLRLPPQPVQADPTATSCWPWRSQLSTRRLARRSATPSWPAPSGSRSASGCRPPTSARPSSSLRRGKGMVLDPERPRHLERRLLLHQPAARPGRDAAGLPDDAPRWPEPATAGSRPRPPG